MRGSRAPAGAEGARTPRAAGGRADGQGLLRSCLHSQLNFRLLLCSRSDSWGGFRVGVRWRARRRCLGAEARWKPRGGPALLSVRARGRGAHG